MSLDHLTHEDALRLAVLLAGPVHAVRIDESSLTLHALTPRGEARIALNPDTRPERYLMRVREALAGHALGSPGGYPVHLRRWTRSGHVNPKSLEALLRPPRARSRPSRHGRTASAGHGCSSVSLTSTCSTAHTAATGS